jgi:hypothetical protein
VNEAVGVIKTTTATGLGSIRMEAILRAAVWYAIRARAM